MGGAIPGGSAARVRDVLHWRWFWSQYVGHDAILNKSQNQVNAVILSVPGRLPVADLGGISGLEMVRSFALVAAKDSS